MFSYLLVTWVLQQMNTSSFTYFWYLWKLFSFIFNKIIPSLFYFLFKSTLSVFFFWSYFYYVHKNYMEVIYWLYSLIIYIPCHQVNFYFQFGSKYQLDYGTEAITWVLISWLVLTHFTGPQRTKFADSRLKMRKNILVEQEELKVYYTRISVYQ